MLTLYKSIEERVSFFFIFSIFSLMSTLFVYLIMEFYFKYQVDNFFIYSVGLFFIGGAVFDSGFKFLMENDQITETGEEYVLVFMSLLLVLIPSAIVAKGYIGFEMTVFLFANFFVGSSGWFVLLSEKTVKKKANDFKIFAR